LRVGGEALSCGRTLCRFPFDPAFLAAAGAALAAGVLLHELRGLMECWLGSASVLLKAGARLPHLVSLVVAWNVVFALHCPPLPA
jgi:hypothetical protein